MMSFAAPERALVRALSTQFDRCLREDEAPIIDVARARAQHTAYVALLREIGLQIETVAPNDAYPDGCFVEDTAVITGAHAVLTVPGAPSRRGETTDVLPLLARHCEVHPMGGDARLDGGDVLRVNDRLFVGLSSRTNRAGLEFLSATAKKDGLRTQGLALASGLHLKSLTTLVDPTTLVHAPSLSGESQAFLRSAGCTLIEVAEPAGANVLALGETIVVSASAPLTAELLRARGKHVAVIDVSELHKADGALTCLSLRLPRAGRWCA
jgi:dimethylargininase